MKNILFTLLFLATGVLAYSQSPIGVWRKFDKNTGEPDVEVQVYKADNGTLEGKIVKLMNPADDDKLCTQCPGARKNQPLLGLVVLEGLEKESNNVWDNGQILDPISGSFYDCTITLISPNELKVRGYIGFSFLGRTEY